MFAHLRQRWQDLFAAQFDVLLYDLTSTYLEGEGEQIPKAKYGYSRDQRFDCKQVIIALVITPEGFPLAYEVMDGNTSDRTTLREFLKKIEGQYGRARRVGVMDRGIPTEAVLAEMRNPEREVFYLVGTPRSKIQQYEKKWLELPWKRVRDQVEVKLFAEQGELYVLAKSEGRQAKERAMRRKRWRDCYGSCLRCGGVFLVVTSYCCGSGQRRKRPVARLVWWNCEYPRKARR